MERELCPPPMLCVEGPFIGTAAGHVPPLMHIPALMQLLLRVQLRVLHGCMHALAAVQVAGLSRVAGLLEPPLTPLEVP